MSDVVTVTLCAASGPRATTLAARRTVAVEFGTAAGRRVKFAVSSTPLRPLVGRSIGPPSAGANTDQHLRACVDRHLDQQWCPDADVLIFQRRCTMEDLVLKLRDFPGCIVCGGLTSDGKLELAIRRHTGIQELRIEAIAALDPSAVAPAASALHAWLLWSDGPSVS